MFDSQKTMSRALLLLAFLVKTYMVKDKKKTMTYLAFSVL